MKLISLLKIMYEDEEIEVSDENAPINEMVLFRGTVIVINEKAVISALEKQIPKKPILRDKYYFYCPCCNEDLAIQEEDISIYSMTPPKYCLHCGQALEWEDTE